MRIALVTNVASHYRLPLFVELGRRASLDVFLTSAGREWYWPAGVGGEDAANVTQLSSRALFRRLSRSEYDVVVIGLTGRASLVCALAAAARRRVPVVLWVGLWEHPRTPLHRLTRPIVRALYRRAAALLVYGSHVAEYVEREAGRREGVVVAPQAVDNERYRPLPDSARVASRRRDLGIRDSKVVCYIGRLEPDKGVAGLVSACGAANVPHKLLIVGDGPERERLEARAAETGVDVRFQPAVAPAHVPELLALADVLVLPSVATPRFREPWGLVVNEAMNAGVTVIASTAVGAVAGGLVVDGATGVVVSEGDDRALADALNHLLEDDETRRRLADAARSHVLDWSVGAAADAFVRAAEYAVSNRSLASIARSARA
jgi:glycosyltransferase involved in cell wall biosynthesis